MTQAITAACLLAAVLLSAAMIVVWTRRKTWLRAAAIPLALGGSAISAAALSYSLGWAVPLIGGLTAPSGELVVLSSKLMIGDGIYVTLDLPGPPRLFWIPWDKKKAEELEEMLSDPENAGAKAVVPPFEFSWDQHEPTFQPMPQPKWLPDKPPEAPKAPNFAA